MLLSSVWFGSFLNISVLKHDPIKVIENKVVMKLLFCFQSYVNFTVVPKPLRQIPVTPFADPLTPQLGQVYPTGTFGINGHPLSVAFANEESVRKRIRQSHPNLCEFQRHHCTSGSLMQSHHRKYAVACKFIKSFSI
jgi:hypothetical protein